MSNTPSASSCGSALLRRKTRPNLFTDPLCLGTSRPTLCAPTRSNSPSRAASGCSGEQGFPPKLSALTLGTDTAPHFRNALAPAPTLHGTSLNNASRSKSKRTTALCFCPSSGHCFSSHELYTALPPSLEDANVKPFKSPRPALAPPNPSYPPAFLSIWGGGSSSGFLYIPSE